MSKKILVTQGDSGEENKRNQILMLQNELDKIQKEILNFEILLRTHVSDLIVESQELFVLYKQIKKAKKAKRLEQKRRGKNYREPKGLQIISKKEKSNFSSEQQKEKKRLYKDAMLRVHPDKFYMNEQETDAANEVTKRLIEIYKTESLETLQAYHAYIFKGSANLDLTNIGDEIKIIVKDDYLQLEEKRLQRDIDLVRDSHLYKVITEYENPLSFVDELKEYYEDRILKLKKRTRKGL